MAARSPHDKAWDPALGERFRAPWFRRRLRRRTVAGEHNRGRPRNFAGAAPVAGKSADFARKTRGFPDESPYSGAEAPVLISDLHAGLKARSTRSQLRQHAGGYQLLLDMALENLHQEPSQIRALTCGPKLLQKRVYRSAKHLSCQQSRFRREFRRCQPLVLRAHQAVGQRMIKSPASIEGLSTSAALAQLRQKSNQPNHPKLKVGRS